MLEQSLLINLSSPGITETTTSQFRYEYQTYQNLFQAQSTLVRQFLGVQAASLAEAVVDGLLHIRFTLPDRVLLQDKDIGAKTISVPTEYREQVLDGLLNRLVHTDLTIDLNSRLLKLEHSANLAVSTSAVLLRHALVMHLMHNVLPEGKSVQYAAENADEIPNIPLHNENLYGSVFTTRTDAEIVEAHRGKVGQLNWRVPYVEAAQGFYLPQWVVFDDHHHLLVKDLNEAKSYIITMKRYLLVLHTAVWLAPYMVADEEYQRKRYGILGQLVNQGRALASYEVEEIIRTIKRRASSHDLDQGLSLSLPFFNDQTLAMEIYHFDVIPVGRVMFVPAFVVLAVRQQGAMVAQDTRLNKSTRRHLLMELCTLEETFLR